LTYRFVKSRQRDGSGAAKKLEEPVSTAPSGLFLQPDIFYFISQRLPQVSHAGRQYYTLRLYLFSLVCYDREFQKFFAPRRPPFANLFYIAVGQVHGKPHGIFLNMG